MSKPPAKGNYLQDLLAQASSQYPYIRRYNPVVTQGHGGDYAETWPINEPGDPSAPRPADIPMDRTGVEVMRPGDFHPADLAAEFLHVDPFANATRNILQQLLSPGQARTLRHSAGDYQDSLNQGTTPEKAMSNAVDSAMRGFTVGQWPADANASMNYSPEQINLLQSLHQYMTQGYYPSNYNMKAGQ